MKKLTSEELERSAWEAVAQSRVKPDTVPPGWRTISDLAEMMGKSERQMSSIATGAIKRGKCEVRKFKIKTGTRIFPVPHYRLKK